jgi:hypothetical protein
VDDATLGMPTRIPPRRMRTGERIARRRMRMTHPQPHPTRCEHRA